MFGESSSSPPRLRKVDAGVWQLLQDIIVWGRGSSGNEHDQPER